MAVLAKTSPCSILLQSVATMKSKASANFLPHPELTPSSNKPQISDRIPFPPQEPFILQTLPLGARSISIQISHSRIV